MSCPDAPSAIIVNSPIAAGRTKARATRFVFKRIVPPYFRVSLVCISQESLARPRCPVGPPGVYPGSCRGGGQLFWFAKWRVRKTNEEPPLKYKTHGAHGSFNRRSGFDRPPSVYRALLDGILCCQRKSSLGCGAAEQLARNIFPDRRAVLEPMPRAPACKPHIFHFRMPVDQKIPVRSVFVLAHARFHNRRVAQGREAPCYIFSNHLRHRGRHHPRLRVRINSLAMLVKRNLQSPSLDVRHSINQVFLKQPRRQRRRRKSHIACRNTEEEHFLP